MSSPNDLHFEVQSADGTLQGSMHVQTDAALVSFPQQQGLSRLSQSSHPVACIFHCFFKLAALVLYILGGYFSTNNKNGKSSGAKFITVSVVLILLLAADFWVVKNITGRLLVGLRWWNQVDGDSTRWIFESAPRRAVNKFDNSVFWSVLYMTPVVWFSLFIIGLLKLELGWLLTVCMALALSGANVYGYYKCSSDQKAKFQQMMQQGAQAGAMSMIRSNLFGFLATTATGGNAASNGSAATSTATYV